MDVRELLRSLLSQDRAVANARRACTELSRLRVVRESVEIFFEERSHPAVVPAQAGVPEDEHRRTASS